jgi:hypothetical protein
MSARKRSHLDLGDAPTLSIKVGSGNCITGVSREVLNLLSSCARGLPADAAQWDLSLLLVEGQHVCKQTVLSWLNKAYLCTYGEMFADGVEYQKQPQQLKKPRIDQQAEAPAQQGVQQGGEGLGQIEAAAGEQQQQQGREGLGQAAATEQKQPNTLSQYDTHKGPTFVALTELLLFADAVGSSPALLQACVSDLEQLAALRLRVLLPEAVPGLGCGLDICVDAICTWGPNHLYQQASSRAPGIMMFPKSAFSSMQAAVTEQTQLQLEALLYAAYKLQLSRLAELLEGFTRLQVAFPNSILCGHLRLIMSPRVLTAAGGFTQLQESMLLDRWCTSPCSFEASIGSCKMTATAPPDGQKFRSSVVMLEDYLGLPKGFKGTVELDVCNGLFAIGGAQFMVQLQVGPPVGSAGDRKRLLGPSPLFDTRGMVPPPAPPAAAADDDL